MTCCPYVTLRWLVELSLTGLTWRDFQQKTYVCTTDAVRNDFCNSTELGRFIIDLPAGKSLSDTTFWTERVAFPAQNKTQTTSGVKSSSESRDAGFWDNPEGNPTPPVEPYTSPWRRRMELNTRAVHLRQSSSETPADLLWYSEPIHYEVKKTGYYCVGVCLTKLPGVSLRLTVIYSHCACDRLVYRHEAPSQHRRAIPSII